MFGSPGVDHFSASRSLRRIPAPMLRPSLFLNGGSPFHHSYNGPPSMISSPFSSSLPRSTNLAQMMAARHSLAMRGHPQPQPQPQQPKKTQLQQQPYCTVEEIKQGKRQREGQQRDEAAEENQYDVEEPDDEEEDEAVDAADEEESSRDGDGDGLYERAPKASRQSRSGPADLMKQRQQQSRQSQTPPLPPPLPPPIPCFNNGKIAMKDGWKTSMPAKKAKEEEGKEMFKQRRNRTKLVLLLLLLVFLCSLLLVLPLTLLWWSGPAAGNDNNNHNSMPTTRLPPEIAKQPPSSAEDPISGSREVLVEAHTLAQWMTSNSKRLRIFEIRDGRQPPTNDDASGSSGSLLAHSVPLQLASLSHNGVPVHPLQLQRLLRAQSVDEDSIVVLYDRHPLGLLAAYALWIFRLYGHDSSFMLNGGLIGWQHFLANNRWNSTDAGGQEAVERRQGTFRAEWRQQLIATFDDLVNNFEPTNHGQADIVDAQSQQEFNGKAPPVSGSTESAAIFGHIRTALNLPVERLCLSGSPSNCGSWGPALDQSSLFAAAGLSPRRPVIVYDGASSLRAAAVWAALHRSNFSAALYFGAWPEWLIRAPDHLKIIPDK